MNRINQIATILEKRRPLAQRIHQTEQNIQGLISELYHLDNYRNNLISKVDDLQIIGYLREIDILTLQRNLENELLTLSKLRSRFARATLNIGVIGRARQGKSRLLQSLSGLTKDEIPDGDRQHCTGVRSTIHHNSNVDTYAEVWFHSERSFLDEIIAPYYQKLGLGSQPMTFKAFAEKPLPPLDKGQSGYAEPGAMYEHLKRYHSNLDKYRHLLGKSSPYQISKHQIREYVAQDTSDGQRTLFNYLAVKEVKITCQFPNPEVGQIALVDMPGLGDTGIGDETRLMKALGEDVDIVLFVRMPKSLGDYWADVDVKLYDIAHNALVELPINEWSFLVLNRTDAHSSNGDNWKNCQDLKETLTEKHISVIDCLIANCSNPVEVNGILDRILNYMVDHIVALDKQYALICQERLINLQKTVVAELGKARQALNQSEQQDNWYPLFVELFDQLWDNLTNGLEALLKELSEDRDIQDADFKTQVDAALQACRTDTGIPTEAEIETRRNRVGGYPNAYYKYLNEVRAHLSQHFLLLDEGLKQGVNRVKCRVADVLINQGGLGKLTEHHDAEFLKSIAGKIPNEFSKGQPSKLKLGFQIIVTFELSYRGLIQHRIREHLDELTPDKTTLQLSDSPSAKEVLTSLSSLQAEAVYNCSKALDDLLAEPSQAAFAIVEEFLDRVLRVEGVKKEWLVFLEQMRSEVWPEEFKQLGERTRTRTEWLEIIERVSTASHLSKMKFLD